jgi:hypothetical protein
LANALDCAHDGHIRRIQIENLQRGNARRGNAQRGNVQLAGSASSNTRTNEALIIAAEGYSPLGPSAQTIAAERHLLETVLRRPVVIRPMKNPSIRSHRTIG